MSLVHWTRLSTGSGGVDWSQPSCAACLLSPEPSGFGCQSCLLLTAADTDGPLLLAPLLLPLLQLRRLPLLLLKLLLPLSALLVLAPLETAAKRAVVPAGPHWAPLLLLLLLLRTVTQWVAAKPSALASCRAAAAHSEASEQM